MLGCGEDVARQPTARPGRRSLYQAIPETIRRGFLARITCVLAGTRVAGTAVTGTQDRCGADTARPLARHALDRRLCDAWLLAGNVRTAEKPRLRGGDPPRNGGLRPGRKRRFLYAPG